MLQARGAACEIAAVLREHGIETGPTRGTATVEDVVVRICLQELCVNAEPGAARGVGLARSLVRLGTERIALGWVGAAVHGQDGASALDRFVAW